jgi:hypothetical protein
MLSKPVDPGLTKLANYPQTRNYDSFDPMKTRNMPEWVVCACFMLVLTSCKKTEGGGGAGPDAFPVAAGVVDEASGIADSRANPGTIWTQQDSGNPPELILLNHQGQLVRKIPVKGFGNRDWEDMALARGPVAGQDYIYLAETGDNDAVYADYAIYRFPEPSATADSISQVDRIRFIYPDGPHDAEAILVEPETLDIYLITKREVRSRIYKLTYPYSTSSVNMAVAAGSLPYNYVVSAAIQPDGKGIAVKDYLNIYYYPRNTGETLSAVLSKAYTKLPYILEPQGEAIGFSIDGNYYFTLSEKTSSAVSLYRFRK